MAKVHSGQYMSTMKCTCREVLGTPSYHASSIVQHCGCLPHSLWCCVHPYLQYV